MPGQTRSAGAPWSRIAAALAVVYVIWGSTYLGIRLAIDAIPPLLMAGARFLLAGLILYPIAARPIAGSRPHPTRRHWITAAVVGVLLLGFGNGVVTLGEEHVASGTVALIVATVPLWIALFAWGIERDAPTLLGGAGLAVGFAGLAVLVHPTGGSAWGTEALVLISPLAWSAGSLYARHAPTVSRPLLGAAMEMIAGGAVLLGAGLLHGEAGHVGNLLAGPGPLLAFVYLISFGSIAGFSCYVWLLQTVPTSIAATYAYVNPLVAVALGTLFLNEPLTATTLVAAGLIVVAVALILAFPRHRRPRGLSSAATEVA